MSYRDMFKALPRSKFLPFGFLFGIAVFMLGANPFAGQTVAPMDLLLSSNGWSNLEISYQSIHPERSDIVDAWLPRWIYAKEQIRNGNLPVWFPLNSGGMPLLFDFTNALLTPSFLAFLAVESNPLGYYLSNLTNITLGLFGMYLLLVKYVGRGAGIFGAIVFVFSGFNAAWFFWPQFSTAIWIPWLIYFAVSYLDRRSSFSALLFVVSAVFINLGGFPFVALCGYIALALIGLVSIGVYREKLSSLLKCWSELLALTFVALVISSPFIVSLFDMFQHIGGIEYRHGGTTLEPNDLDLYIDPNKFGVPLVESSVYLGVIPLFLIVYSLVALFSERSILNVSGLVVLLVSTLVAFGILDENIVRSIPFFDNNPWNRMVVLSGFGVAMSSAYAFDRLVLRFDNRCIIVGLSFILIGFQFFDQKSVFRDFNGVVPDGAFYPMTKSIENAVSGVSDFNYVLADSGYLFSGTLGGYGLAEWFAHGFKSNGEKDTLNNIVDDSFVSPTAARFDCDQIRFGSKYMDLMGVKYVLCSNSFGQIPYELDLMRELGMKPAPSLPDNKLTQTIVLDVDTKITGFSFLFATYGRSGYTSDINVTLNGPEGVIGEGTIDKKRIRDNRWKNALFGAPLTLKAGVQYGVSLEIVNESTATPLTVWTNMTKGDERLIVNGEITDFALNMKLVRDPLVADGWSVDSHEDGIYLFRNESVIGGAYFIRSLESDEISYDGLSARFVSPSDIEIEYTSTSEGYVVLPIRFYDGWSVYNVDDGSKLSFSKLFGMMPAFKVSGPGVFRVIYKPNYFFFLMSLFGWAVFFCLLFKTIYRRTVLRYLGRC